MDHVEVINPQKLVRAKRKITGASAVLLPMTSAGAVDWPGFERLVGRTFDAGLIPAINMDTGYGNLLSPEMRQETLAITQRAATGRDFIGGVFVHDRLGDVLKIDDYRRGIEQVNQFGGTPIFFQSYGLAHGPDDQIVANYRLLANECDSFYAFELGTMFAPFGNIYSIEVFAELMRIENCLGAKHSSLDRGLEWERLRLRDQVRPEFRLMTGNDLAIDMVMYGSDYLLGLSTFAPDAFAARDAMWESGDPGFYQLNDVLQYLGAFAFRPTVPAYKHDAAMFLKIRNQIGCDATFPGSPERPDSDREVLRLIAEDIERHVPSNAS